MQFTYYGDLLGVSRYFKLSPEVAYSKLNMFYNITFSSLESYCRANSRIEVNMFSDSFLMWGNDAIEALRQLHNVYRKLLDHCLLLRGAMVSKRLKIDPRLTLSNFQKMLPKDDTLARAVGLENSQKGARLIIENQLARSIFQHCQQWLTHEGYIAGVKLHPQNEDVLRRICPVPDNNTYEFLYFWPPEQDTDAASPDYSIKEDLKETQKMLAKELQVHYRETSQLLMRCNRRNRFTEKALHRESLTNRSNGCPGIDRH